MANNAKNILVSGNAMVHVVIGGLPRAEWPKSYDEVLPANAVDLGLTNDDGEALDRAIETASIHAHQGPNQRTISTGGEMNLSLSALEHNPVSEQLYFGAAYVDGVSEVNADTITTVTVIYDTFDIQNGYEKAIRIVGDATVSPNGSITYTRSDATPLPLMFKFNGSIVRMKEPDAA